MNRHHVVTGLVAAVAVLHAGPAVAAIPGVTSRLASAMTRHRGRGHIA
jgi:hypothetical protein